MLKDLDLTEEQKRDLRRLDSISRLFEGGNTCASVVSTKKGLLVTSNYTIKTQKDYMELVKSFLQDIATGNITDLREMHNLGIPIKIVKKYFTSNERYALADLRKKYSVDDKTLGIIIQDILNAPSLKPENKNETGEPKSKKLKPSRKTIFNYYPTEEVEKIIEEKSNNLPEVLKIINKGMGYISSSIRKVLATLLEPDIESEWIEQVREKKIEIIENKKLKKGILHAEMSLIQHLIDNELIDTSEQIYVGISKSCCLNCISVIKALNDFYTNNINESVIIVKRSHYKGFEKNWIMPKFVSEFKIQENYKNFLILLGVEPKEVLTGIASESDTEPTNNYISTSLGMGVLVEMQGVDTYTSYDEFKNM
jgi:hypothetical protein